MPTRSMPKGARSGKGAAPVTPDVYSLTDIAEPRGLQTWEVSTIAVLNGVYPRRCGTSKVLSREQVKQLTPQLDRYQSNKTKADLPAPKG